MNLSNNHNEARMLPLSHLAIPKTPRIEIAFLGRFYFNPGLGKTSRYYVYATDLRGRRKLRISPGPVKAGTEVRWADGNTVAWKTDQGWTLYDVRTGRLAMTSTTPKVSARAVPWTWEDEGSLAYKGQPKISWTGADLVGPLLLTRGSATLQVRRDGVRATRVVPTLEPTRTLAVLWSGSANGMEDEEEIVRFDWKLGKVFPWHRHLKETQFFPDRDIFLARHEGRSLVPYGRNGNVWGDRIYAGRMTTNEMWTVVGGTAWCGTPALRP